MKLFNRLAFDLVYILWLLAVVIWVGVHVCHAGEIIKVAVIDTGLDRNDPRFSSILCDKGHHNFVSNSDDTKDNDGHGTYIAALIQKYAVNTSYCLIIYKFFDAKSTAEVIAKAEILALQAAIKEGAVFVNMSFGGRSFEEEEYLAFKNAPASITFVAAAGNEGKELKAPYEYYPASYELPNIIVVGALNGPTKRLAASNYGDRVQAWEQGIGPLAAMVDGTMGAMQGTSIAAAIYTGRLISLKGLRK